MTQWKLDRLLDHCQLFSTPTDVIIPDFIQSQLFILKRTLMNWIECLITEWNIQQANVAFDKWMEHLTSEWNIQQVFKIAI